MNGGMQPRHGSTMMDIIQRHIEARGNNILNGFQIRCTGLQFVISRSPRESTLAPVLAGSPECRGHRSRGGLGEYRYGYGFRVVSKRELEWGR